MLNIVRPKNCKEHREKERGVKIYIYAYVYVGKYKRATAQLTAAAV